MESRHELINQLQFFRTINFKIYQQLLSIFAIEEDFDELQIIIHIQALSRDELQEIHQKLQQLYKNL